MLLVVNTAEKLQPFYLPSHFQRLLDLAEVQVLTP